MPSGYAPIPTSFTSITISSSDLCGAGWERPIRPIRRDDCFQDCGTHALKALGDDGSKIELDQSETTMSDLSGTAAAHWIVPVG